MNTSSNTLAVIDASDTSAPYNDDKDALQDLIVACDNVASAGDAARGGLKAVALRLFRGHVAALVSSSGILPSNLKGAAQSLVWRDATGVPKAVETKERTAGQKLLGEYLSEFSRVAMDETYGGLDALATVEAMSEAKDAIKDAAKQDKGKTDLVAAALVEARYNNWLEGLPAHDRLSITRTRALFKAGNGAGEFAPIIAAQLIAAGK